MAARKEVFQRRHQVDDFAPEILDEDNFLPVYGPHSEKLQLGNVGQGLEVTTAIPTTAKPFRNPGTSSRCQSFIKTFFFFVSEEKVGSWTI